MMWHGSCYRKRIDDKFPVGTLDDGDVDGDELDDKMEVSKFSFARDGDHLMCPFQCDLCQFRNIMGRNPGAEMVRDRKILIAIRRAILDAFWGRATHTVRNNKNTLRRFHEIGAQELGLPEFLPPMGPFPLNDLWGMKQAVATLVRSMDQGKYKNTLQFDTVRKCRSTYSNCWAAGVHAHKNSVIARDTIKTYVTTCPTQGYWFERFMKGLHSRMGDDHRPDAAISVDVMKAIMERVNLDYIESESYFRKRYYARAGLFFMAAYLGSLRGEEVARMVKRYFIKLNKESNACPIESHVVLPLYGSFKGEGGRRRCFMLRVVNMTKSGLNMRMWVDRVVKYEQESNTVYLFADETGRKESANAYEGYLFGKLESVQAEENGLIGKNVNVGEIFGISRSFRRGSTTAATNAPNDECDGDDIDRNNRWRKENNAGTKKASLSMVQLYTETLQTVKADLKFSRVL